MSIRAAISGWLAAFAQAGQELADITRQGHLERGLRSVITHHVIFNWNRLGLSYTEQHTLSILAKEVVMAEPEEAASVTGTSTGNVGEMIR